MRISESKKKSGSLKFDYIREIGVRCRIGDELIFRQGLFLRRIKRLVAIAANVPIQLS